MDSVAHRLFRTKPTDQIVAEGGHGEGGELRRTMTLWQLTLFSVGATLGTGIFVILGQAVPKAGPAVVLAFVLAAITALFSALSYAELAGTIPVSGSSYSYAYATLGELVAWVVRLVPDAGVRRLGRGGGGGLGRVPQLTSSRTCSACSCPPRSPTPPAAGRRGQPHRDPDRAAATCCCCAARRRAPRPTRSCVLIKIGVLVFFCVVASPRSTPGNLSRSPPWASPASRPPPCSGLLLLHRLRRRLHRR